MTADMDLYEAILARRSVRRYDREPVAEATLDQVRAIARNVMPLRPRNRWEAQVKTLDDRQSLAEAFGGYGLLVSPPHLIAAALIGGDHPLHDYGFRMEQVAVRLTQLGLGSCFIGALPREDAVRALFGLPRNARTPATLIFGHPAQGLGDRAVNRVMSTAARADHKRPLEQLTFAGDFSTPGLPPPPLLAVLEAGRNAPSALNVQPWRFVWLEGQVFLFCEANNRKYGDGETRLYKYHDAGACMANMSLALEALGLRGSWTVLDDATTEITPPAWPPELEPIARLTLE